jgi:hypothetical protein
MVTPLSAVCAWGPAVGTFEGVGECVLRGVADLARHRVRGHVGSTQEPGSDGHAPGDIADTLVGKIADRTKPLKTGDGRRSCDMGPLVTEAAQERVSGYIGAGEEAGATLVVDGRQGEFDADGQSFFVGPTLFDNVGTGMSMYTDEIFGPVLSVVRVEELAGR